MARWVRQDGDHDVDEFVIMGPIRGASVRRLYGSLFPEDSSVTIERVQGTIEHIAWGELDSISLESGDALVLPSIPLAAGPLLYVVNRLLGPSGCPWDREQTSDTLVRYLLDESYEAAEAIVSGDSEAVVDELGDVLLQVAFQGAIRPDTSFDAIVQQQAEKLVRRHPHVFSREFAPTSDAVRQQWDQIKSKEARRQTSATWIYPSLAAAKRLSKSDIHPESTVYQEILDLLEVYFDNYPGKIEEILADAAWAVAEAGRIHHQDAEWALWKKVARLARQRNS